MATSSAPTARRVAVVTGGGTGLGRAIGLRLAHDGYDLVIASRSLEHLEEGAELLRRAGARVIVVPTDVREPAAVESLFLRAEAELGRVDLLVNNAAGNFLAPAEAISPNGWRAVLGIVLDGTFYCSRAAYPRLVRAGGGAIVNIVASYAWMAGPGTAHSAAAKAGVLALTRTLAVEWAARGIRVNAVAPGPVHTEGTDRQLWLSTELVERVTEDIPMGRFGTPEEVAEAVAFLASDRAAYITGQVLAVDGGQWLGRGVMRFGSLATPRGTGSPPGSGAGERRGGAP